MASPEPLTEPNPAAAPAPIPLSVLIRTVNDADRIAATITSVLPLGAEIVVINSGSKDDTVAIATKLGARVIFNPWPGFGPQRRFGEDACKNDFVFSLNSDEIVTPAMAREIRALFQSPSPPQLIIVRKALIFPHHKKPPPFGFYHEQILIYDRRIARTDPNPNWDKLTVTAAETPVTIKEPLWHYSFRDWHHMVGKANYIAKLAGDTQSVRSRAMLVVRLFTEFPLTFLKFYFLRLYCLGGVDGFTMAVMTAFGRWARIVMMLERHDHGGKSR